MVHLWTAQNVCVSKRHLEMGTIAISNCQTSLECTLNASPIFAPGHQIVARTVECSEPRVAYVVTVTRYV